MRPALHGLAHRAPDGVFRNSNRHTDLVPTAEDPDSLTLLLTCGDSFEASMVRSALEAHDIYSYVQGENHRALLGGMGAFIELRVLVRRADLDDARELLEELRRTPASDDDVAEEEPAEPAASLPHAVAREDRRRR
jgi:hypothetical protein